jgi:uncharacterized membrane protein HdeD (DUF308 family)
MGAMLEAILERQEGVARQEDRNRRLGDLYSQARRLHRDRKWQAAIDLLARIHSEDSNYPDPEGLSASSSDALELERRAASLYDRGLRYMKAEEWRQALECFEEVQRLQPGFRDTEELLSRVHRERAQPPTVNVPDLAGQRAPQARSRLGSEGLKLDTQEKVANGTIPEGQIIEQSPEAGTEVEAGSFVSITVSSGPQKVAGIAPPDDRVGERTYRAQRTQFLLPEFAGSWWALALRGLLMIVFALLLFALVFPEITTFRLLSALIIITDGVIAAIDATTSTSHRRPLLKQGIISGLVGLFVLAVWYGGTISTNLDDLFKSLFLAALLVGAWAIVIGIIRIVAAMQLRWETKNLWPLGASGVSLTVFGILLLSGLPLGQGVPWYSSAFLMLVSGIALIAAALRVRDR